MARVLFLVNSPFQWQGYCFWSILLFLLIVVARIQKPSKNRSSDKSEQDLLVLKSSSKENTGHIFNYFMTKPITNKNISKCQRREPAKHRKSEHFCLFNISFPNEIRRNWVEQHQTLLSVEKELIKWCQCVMDELGAFTWKIKSFWLWEDRAFSFLLCPPAPVYFLQ